MSMEKRGVTHEDETPETTKTAATASPSCGDDILSRAADAATLAQARGCCRRPGQPCRDDTSDQ